MWREWRREEAEMERMRRCEAELTYLLGHSVEEVAVSALLLPCPHEARLLSTRRSGAELHGAFACSLSAAANDANATQTTSAAAAGVAAAAATVATGGDARANASCAGGSVSLSWRWPGRLWVCAGLLRDCVALTASHIQLCLLGLRQRERERQRGRAGGMWECEGGEKRKKSQ